MRCNSRVLSKPSSFSQLLRCGTCSGAHLLLCKLRSSQAPRLVLGQNTRFRKNSFNKIIGILLAFFIFSNSHAQTNILNVYNWSGYLPDDVLRQFQQETGIKVNYSTYDSNETLYAKLKANPRAGYDIIVPSTYFIDRMRKQHMLQKIDKSRLSNFKNLNPDLLNKDYDPHNEYSIPYFWSSTGIVVNKRYLSPKSIKAWSDLWDPKYKDQLLLLNDTREVFSMALLVLGYSANDKDPEHIKQAYEKLKELMPNVRLFNNEAPRSIYIDEDITVGMGWSGDIFLAQRENPNIQFIYPQEGYVVSLDSIAIPKDAPDLDNAYKFIDFILRADIAKRITLSVGYGTPNLEATKLMPKEYLKNPIIFPDKQTLKRAQFQTDAGKASALFEKYLELLKIGG